MVWKGCDKCKYYITIGNGVKFQVQQGPGRVAIMFRLNVEERIWQDPFNLPTQLHKSLDINESNGWVIVDFF